MKNVKLMVSIVALMVSGGVIAANGVGNFQLKIVNDTPYDITFTKAYIEHRDNGWQILDAGANKTVPAGKMTCYSHHTDPAVSEYPNKSDKCSATQPFSWAGPPFSNATDRRHWKLHYKCNGDEYPKVVFKTTHNNQNGVPNSVDEITFESCGRVTFLGEKI